MVWVDVCLYSPSVSWIVVDISEGNSMVHTEVGTVYTAPTHSVVAQWYRITPVRLCRIGTAWNLLTLP